MTPAALKMTKARIALVTSQPFFGSLALKLDVRERAGLGTMGTNGIVLDYDPAFVDPLPQAELIAVVAHEVMHCALHHTTRRAGRDHKLWNIACDYAINPIIRDAKFSLPKDALIDPRFEGLSAEQIYSQLQQEAGEGDGEGQGQGQGDVPGDRPGSSCGEFSDTPGDDGGTPSEASNAKAEDDWNVATIQAAQAGKAAGKLPGFAIELVEAIRNPSVDYREALRRFMLNRVPSDSQWTPPNRRYVSRGLYLPSLRCEALGEIVVAIDTSGSTSSFRRQFAGDLTAISEDLRPSRLHVLYCDTRIQRHDEYEAGEPVDASMIGGGGTDFRPIFDYVTEKAIDPACVVVLTDLEGPFPSAAPDFPVLFVATGAGAAPFGETIRMRLDGAGR